MQAIALLATQYILVKILPHEICRIDPDHRQPSLYDSRTSLLVSGYCQNIEKIISILTIPIQLLMIGLTVLLQMFTSKQNVTIPVAVMSFLYFV